MKRLALSVAVSVDLARCRSGRPMAAARAPAKTAAANWVEGRNYSLIPQPRPTGLPAGSSR